MQTLIEKLEVLLESLKTEKPREWLDPCGFWKPDISNAVIDAAERMREIRLKPTPKLRPWRLEEVPLEGWFRVKGYEKAKRIEHIQPTVAGCVCVHQPNTLAQMLLEMEWTLTPFDAASWKPCGVEE